MRNFLGFLLALLELSSVNVVNAIDYAPRITNPCRVRAWVRAPDLEPGKIIQGDVKVKLDDACGPVDSCSLRLRFAERSWVKTRREGIDLPKKPAANHSIDYFSSDESIFEPDPFWRHAFSRFPGVDHSVLEQYESDMKDPSLWLVREEERIGFETKYKLHEGQQIGHELIESFAILVPSTNYPPAFGGSSSGSSIDPDNAGAEHVYAYFVDVTFANGTSREIPAGYTSFNARIAMAPPTAETVNVTAIRFLPDREDEDGNAKEGAEDEFTLEVTFPNGRHLEQGSTNNVTVTSHQLGPALQRPERIDYITVHAVQKRSWAARFAADDETATKLLESESMQSSQLKPTDPQAESLHSRRDFFDWDSKVSRPDFSQDGLVKNGSPFATEAVTAQFTVKENCYPSFHMHYQSSEAELSLHLAVRNISSAEMPAAADEDEYDWTPVMNSTYVPIDILRAKIPLFVHATPQDEQTRLMAALTVHYLSPEARAPIFVNPSTVTDLLHQSVKDRDSLAPKAQARFVTPDGDVVKHRYYGRYWWPEQPGDYYVGDTWLRKVVLPGKEREREAKAKGGKLVIQS